ncbi:MAG: LysR family transcriptional regulator [Stellaceae bacterium]
MQDRLDALTIFVAVAERQSFAEAARRLGRSPAAVTRAVAGLEERLQIRLFNRTTRSVALTDAGARYLESCRRLLATYDVQLRNTPLATARRRHRAILANTVWSPAQPSHPFPIAGRFTVQAASFPSP